MTVHLSDAASLRQLVNDLLAGGCVPATVGEATLEVTHPEAEDPEEARSELLFFLRAWQSAHPEAELTFTVAY
jgi:hypothetical protein